MPKRKRTQREQTEDWQTVKQSMLWPEQKAYELLRPLVQIARDGGRARQRNRWKSNGRCIKKQISLIREACRACFTRKVSQSQV